MNKEYLRAFPAPKQTQDEAVRMIEMRFQVALHFSFVDLKWHASHRTFDTVKLGYHGPENVAHKTLEGLTQILLSQQNN